MKVTFNQCSYGTIAYGFSTVKDIRYSNLKYVHKYPIKENNNYPRMITLSVKSYELIDDELSIKEGIILDGNKYIQTCTDENLVVPVSILFNMSNYSDSYIYCMINPLRSSINYIKSTFKISDKSIEHDAHILIRCLNVDKDSPLYQRIPESSLTIRDWIVQNAIEHLIKDLKSIMPKKSFKKEDSSHVTYKLLLNAFNSVSRVYGQSILESEETILNVIHNMPSIIENLLIDKDLTSERFDSKWADIISSN